MKKLFIFLFGLGLLFSVKVSAQAIYAEPAQFNPEDTVKIFIDITKCDNQALLDNPGPLYIWTWKPADPVAGNGSWDNSNEALIMTNEAPNLWSIKFIPTEFYGVDRQSVYDENIFMLAKAKDGSDVGNGEQKTEDLELEIDPPSLGPRKVYSFPDKSTKDTIAGTKDDIFTLLYDNTLEEKATMQNATELYVYARAYDLNENEFRVEALRDVGTNPLLRMTTDGSGLFKWTIWPKEMFQIPDNIQLNYLRLQIIKKTVNSSDDAVDGTFNYYFRCQ